MAKFVFNGKPRDVKIIFAGLQWKIPSGKTSFSDLKDKWDEEFDKDGRPNVDSLLSAKGISVEDVVNHGANGQDLAIAVGYESDKDVA